MSQRGGHFGFSISKNICNNSMYTSGIYEHENILLAIKFESLRNLEMKLWKYALIRGGHFEFSLSKNNCNNSMDTIGVYEHENILIASKFESLRNLEMKLWKYALIRGGNFEFSLSKNDCNNSMYTIEKCKKRYLCYCEKYIFHSCYIFRCITTQCSVCGENRRTKHKVVC
jgi:hypothetical protein